MKEVRKYVVVRKYGNDNLAIGIPKEIVRELGLRKGDQLHVCLESENGFSVEKVETKAEKSGN